MKPLAGFVLLAAGAGTLLTAIAYAALRKRRRMRRRVIGVIPARFQSVRFPGKPLVDIAGKPMVVRTWERAAQARTLDALVVATDDDKIAEVCRAAGARVVMTSPTCANGTERCHEAVASLPERYDIVINIQGDEPLMEPENIDGVVRALQDAPDAVYSTACTPLALEEVPLRHRVKCVTDVHGYAIYFSRGILPANKDGTARPYPAPFSSVPYLLHLGLQCYDASFLATFCRLPPTPLMLMEDLEQLKVIENGYRAKVIVVQHCAHGVDEPEDVASIEAKMRELGIA